MQTIALRELPSGFALEYGAHDTFDQGACLLEAVAYIAGEEHSDAPKCASQVLADFGRSLNDHLGDEDRQLLIPLVPLLVGTASTYEHDRRRARVLADAALRGVIPLALEVAGWTDQASVLRQLAPITDECTTALAGEALAEVQRVAVCRHCDNSDAQDDAAHAVSAADGAISGYPIEDRGDAIAYAMGRALDAAAPLSAARRQILDAIIAAFRRAIEVRP